MTRNIGDVLDLDVTDEELNNQKIRIIAMDDPSLHDGIVRVVCRREEDYLNTFDDYLAQEKKAINTMAELPYAVRPVIFEIPAVRVSDEYHVGVTAIRYDEDTVACRVWASEDDVDFSEIGMVRRPAYVGDINTNFDDTAKTIEIDVTDYPDAFSTYAVEEQRNDRTFSLVGELQTGDCELANLEFLSFREASTSGNVVTLKNCYRGKNHTIPKSHTTDEVLLQVGTDRYFRFKYPQSKVGKTIYVKCTAMNIRGKEEKLADVDSYEYTISGDTRKATHVSGLQIYDGSSYRGSLDTVDAGTVTVKWKETNRVGSWGARSFITGWEWNDFETGDVNNYKAIIYDSSENFIATHDITGVATEYEYTQTQNEADFGSLTKDFYIGIQPTNPRGAVADIVKKHILLNI